MIEGRPRRAYVALIILLVFLGCREQDSPATTEAGRVLADVRRIGRDSVAALMDRDDVFGERVLDGIGSGDSTWLEVAVALRGTGYADIAESLPISTAEALPNAPERVLSLIQRREFSIDEVCTIPFIKPSDSLVAAYYAKASAALRSVSRADVAAERDRCQAALERAHASSARTAVTATADSAQAQAQAQSTKTRPRILERHRLDMDEDGVKDDLLVWFSDSLDPGIIGKIELRLSKLGTVVLEDINRWDQVPNDFKGTHNLVKSKLIYLANFPQAGQLLFLFGPSVGCCGPDLTIYRLGASGAQKYFHATQFVFYRSPNPGVSQVATMALAGVSEGMGPPTAEFVSATTYDPIVVYRLGERVQIDSAASEAITRKALGGFAGMESRSDVRAVVRRDSTRALWDDRAGRIIP